MKKLFFKFLNFLNKRFLQLILFVFACLSWVECSEIGRKSYGIRESGIAKNSYSEGFNNSYSETITGGAAVDVSTGFNGGALAMGLITCMCIFGIVWIEISRKSKS